MSLRLESGSFYSFPQLIGILFGLYRLPFSSDIFIFVVFLKDADVGLRINKTTGGHQETNAE